MSVGRGNFGVLGLLDMCSARLFTTITALGTHRRRSDGAIK